MLSLLIACVGLAVDMGRSLAARGDLQSFVDNAALAAVLQLDGTTTGITRANAAVTNATNGTQGTKWDFGTKTFPSYTTDFAKGISATPNFPDPATWTTNPNPAADYRFARVSANLAVPLTFMQAINVMKSGSVGSAVQVKAVAVAGQALITTYPNGLLPFSPIGPSSEPDNFGLTKGLPYTLRYPTPSGTKKMNVCPGDVGRPYVDQLPSEDRGYWGPNSANAIRGSIVDNVQTATITIGEPVPMVGGAKATEGDALNMRVLQDSDPTSATYAEYISKGEGNGRRIIPVPINDGPPNFIAVGIGAFFLGPVGIYNALGGDDPLCGEYIGPYVEGGMYSGAGATASVGNTGGYKVRLIQ